MARVQFSAIVNSVRGKVGGSVFQRNRSGFSFKNSASGVNRQSEKQIFSRSNVVKVQTAWRQMSSTERNAWQLFANFNPVYNRNNKNVFLNGYQLFMKYNLIRLHCNLTILEAITYGTVTNLDVSVTFQRYDSSLDVIFDSAFNASDYRALLHVSNARSIDYPLKAKYYKLCQFSGYYANRGYIAAGWNSLFAGLPSVGQYIPYKITIIDLAMPIIREGFFDIAIIETYSP